MYASAKLIAERLAVAALIQIRDKKDALPLLDGARAALEIECGDRPVDELLDLYELALEYDDAGLEHA